MDRYFFHIDYGEPSLDGEGSLFPSLQDAQSAAVQLLGRLLIDEGDGFWDKPNITVTVTDANGLTLWTVEAMGLATTTASRFG